MASQASPRPVILYIDDSDGEALLLRLQLDREGIEVETEANAARGVAAYDPARHCAVLIDWNLPDAQGPETARALLERDPGCAIAFASCAFTPDRVAAAAALGIRDCFEKELNLDYVRRISAFAQASRRPAGRP